MSCEKKGRSVLVIISTLWRKHLTCLCNAWRIAYWTGDSEEIAQWAQHNTRHTYHCACVQYDVRILSGCTYTWLTAWHQNKGNTKNTTVQLNTSYYKVRTHVHCCTGNDWSGLDTHINTHTGTHTCTHTGTHTHQHTHTQTHSYHTHKRTHTQTKVCLCACSTQRQNIPTSQLLFKLIHNCVCVHYVHAIYALYTYVVVLQLETAVMHMHMCEVINYIIVLYVQYVCMMLYYLSVCWWMLPYSVCVFMGCWYSY